MVEHDDSQPVASREPVLRAGDAVAARSSQLRRLQAANSPCCARSDFARTSVCCGARAANASARHFPGLGLGLRISQVIVEQHGGRIWVESAGHEQGSTFHLVLPYVPVGPADA